MIWGYPYFLKHPYDPWSLDLIDWEAFLCDELLRWDFYLYAEDLCFVIEVRSAAKRRVRHEKFTKAICRSDLWQHEMTIASLKLRAVCPWK